MDPILQVNDGQRIYAHGQVCPQCGEFPTKVAELLNRGVMIGTYSHGDRHIWTARWIEA